MIRVHLPPDEADRLDPEFRSAADRKYRDRLQIVLMAHRGRRHLDIATDLGVTTRTVQRCLDAYLERGLDGARPREVPGPAGHILRPLDATIQQWVIDGTAKPGPDRANWTHAELTDHPLNVKGIRPSSSLHLV